MQKVKRKLEWNADCSSCSILSIHLRHRQQKLVNSDDQWTAENCKWPLLEHRVIFMTKNRKSPESGSSSRWPWNNCQLVVNSTIVRSVTDGHVGVSDASAAAAARWLCQTAPHSILNQLNRVFEKVVTSFSIDTLISCFYISRAAFEKMIFSKSHAILLLLLF